MKKLRFLTILMICLNSFSQDKVLNIPVFTNLKDSTYSNLEKSIGLSVDINYQIQKNMDKQITRKQLDEKAMPLQKSLDSLSIILDNDDRNTLKYYQAQLANILVVNQVASNKKKTVVKKKKQQE